MEKLTLTSLLKQAAGKFPSRRALSVSGKYDLTHARLQQLVDQAASRLIASGINAGDVVALTFPNTAEINCAVIPREDTDIREEEVLRFCKKNLASFKVPKKVFITDSLPKTATGKIQRRFVAEHFLAQISTAKVPKFGA